MYLNHNLQVSSSVISILTMPPKKKPLSARSSPKKKADKPRPQYSIREKVEIVKYAAKKKAEKWSIRRVARRRKVSERSIRNWIKDYKNMIAFENQRAVRMRTTFAKSQLVVIQEELLQFIFERREQGYAVIPRTLILKASTLLPEFSIKTLDAQKSALRRFLMKANLVYRIGTHVSQKSPLETVSDALDFVEIVRPFLYGPSRHPKYILNMDQTPVYYSMHEKKTLETKGVRTVNLRTCKNDSERITVGVTISADGDLLPPTIVFKGKCRIPFYIYYFVFLFLIPTCSYPSVVTPREA